jgi:hypothetical protein
MIADFYGLGRTEGTRRLKRIACPTPLKLLVYNPLRYFKISFYVNSHVDKLFGRWKRID